MTVFHGNGVFFAGRGLLLAGPSGSGKSDLSLRLMGLGGQLVGDDYVTLCRTEKGRLVMNAPKNITGQIEVRHVGILKVPFRPAAQVDLILKLLPRERLVRLPLDNTFMTLEEVAVPCLDFHAFDQSAVDKIHAALKILSGND